jgi:hypothetical protein
VRQPAVGPFASAARADWSARAPRGMHAPSLLTPFSLPSLPSSLHLQTFPHQDSTNEGPFALAHHVRSQGYPRVFRSRPQFHGCEGVSGKRGGAFRAARETGWARAKACERPDDGCSNPPGISPGKRPENAPDPRAYCGAYFRADSRASSRSKSTIPQSIAGAVLSLPGRVSNVGRHSPEAELGRGGGRGERKRLDST